MKVGAVSGDLVIELAIGAVVIGAAWWAISKLSGAASSAVNATADAVVGAAHVADSGVATVVTGIGSAVGLPTTNDSECAQLLREGKTWEASFKCPAGTFLSYLGGNNPQQDYTWQAHGAR